MAVRRVSIVLAVVLRVPTIALRKPAAHSTIALVIHPLNHHAVSLKVVSYIVAPSPLPASPTVLQPINLLLSALGFLLCIFELLLQLLDLAILL